MIDKKTIAQVKAYARIDGALLSLVWIASFAITIMQPTNIFGQILTLCTPFFVGWRQIKFRNEVLDGHISFRRAYTYCFYTFIYAALIFAIVQYVYFRFLDHGRFTSMMVDTLNMLAPVYEKNGVPREQIDEVSKTIMKTSPAELTFIFMVQNILVGMVVSIFIAVFGRKGVRS